MQIEYLISALIGFAVALLFVILPSYYRYLKLAHKKYIENIVIDFLHDLQTSNKNGDIKQEQKEKEKR
jgi:hypothetical protein